MMIRVPEVRVIDADGTQLGVLSRDDALARARERELDLVEIAPTAVPPVCRIMDFGKFKYEQKKKQQKSRSKQHVIQVKEIRFRPKTDDHDMDTKNRQARGFLEEGNKVQVTVRFRGREVTHPEIAQTMLQDFASRLAEVGKVERFPKLEGKQMVMILTPLKMPAS